jgi:hypothetical protein
MFLKNSRYYGLDTVETVDRQGRPVKAIKRRKLNATTGDATVVQGPDKLDVMAQRNYKDATKFWHIADANTELEANELTRVAGRVIDVPKK